MKNILRFIACVFLMGLVVFISCKKERSCEGCAANNKPPLAAAGPDQAITLPTDSVLLDGSKFSDPDGKISVWQWTNISGPASFIFTNSSAAKTTIKKLVEGVYRFELKVTDDKGLSAKDTVQVMVNGPGNQPPVACAGSDQTMTLPAATVNLDGSCSSDPDNNITGYAWTKISGPASFSIANATAGQTAVTNLTEGAYQFELKVTDASGLFSKDTVQVMVNQTPNNPPVDIYVSGYTYNGSQHEATYWKNGHAVPLFNGSIGAIASSIIVAGNDVYMAGWDLDSNGTTKSVAKYWKNGQAITLTNGSVDAQAYSIAVVGNDVYVAGGDESGDRYYDADSNVLYHHVAKYWKNGQAVALTNGSISANTTDITVVGRDVYVSGFFRYNPSHWKATYWKNGQAVSLTNRTNVTIARSIIVVGSDVYVAGVDGGAATYWKNGQAVALTNGQYDDAKSIAVVGSDVYVAGNVWNGSQGQATYWKNGQAVTLSSGSKAVAKSIAVIGNDVYVSGYKYNGSQIEATYWKNGQAVMLPGGSDATCIVVVRR